MMFSNAKIEKMAPNASSEEEQAAVRHVCGVLVCDRGRDAGLPAHIISSETATLSSFLLSPQASSGHHVIPYTSWKRVQANRVGEDDSARTHCCDRGDGISFLKTFSSRTRPPILTFSLPSYSVGLWIAVAAPRGDDACLFFCRKIQFARRTGSACQGGGQGL